MTTKKTNKPPRPSDNLLSYVLGCLDTETEDGNTLATEKERIQNVASAFIAEFNYEANRRRYPNRQERVSQWIMGIPSTLTVEIWNSGIIELGSRFGYKLETEKKQDAFLDKWFLLVAFKLLQIANRNGVSFGEI